MREYFSSLLRIAPMTSCNSGSDEHCGAGAYYDVLVTDDAAFRSTCELVPYRPFALERSTNSSRGLGGG
jgi:hypothetical protein